MDVLLSYILSQDQELELTALSLILGKTLYCPKISYKKAERSN